MPGSLSAGGFARGSSLDLCAGDPLDDDPAEDIANLDDLDSTSSDQEEFIQTRRSFVADLVSSGEEESAPSRRSFEVDPVSSDDGESVPLGARHKPCPLLTCTERTPLETIHYNRAHEGQWVGHLMDYIDRRYIGCTTCLRLFTLPSRAVNIFTSGKHLPGRHPKCVMPLDRSGDVQAARADWDQAAAAWTARRLASAGSPAGSPSQARTTKKRVSVLCPFTSCDDRDQDNLTFSKHFNTAHFDTWSEREDEFERLGYAGCECCRRLFRLEKGKNRSSNGNHRPGAHQRCFPPGHDMAAHGLGLGGASQDDDVDDPDRQQPPQAHPDLAAGAPTPAAALPRPTKLPRSDYIRECRSALGLFLDACDASTDPGDDLALFAALESFLGLGQWVWRHNKFNAPASLPERRRQDPAYRDPALLRAVELLCGSGDISKAAQALSDDATVLSPTDPAVAQKLQGLYPSKYPPNEGDPAAADRFTAHPEAEAASPGPDSARFRRALWENCVRRKRKASGLSGWSFSRVMQVWDCHGDGQAVAFRDVARLVDLLLGPKLFSYPLLRDLLVQQRGIALSKPTPPDVEGPAVRPIGITEVFVRLAASYLVTSNTEVLKSQMHEHCFGFGVEGGSEALAATVRGLLRLHPDWCTLKADFANAFNTAWRETILDQGDLPGHRKMANFIRLINGRRSLVYYGGLLVIVNEEGVIQGMPDAAVFFELIMQDLLRSVRALHPDVYLLSIYDDTNMVGPPPRVAAAAVTLERLAWEKYRLKFVAHKSLFYFTGDHSGDWFDALRARGFRFVNLSPDPTDHGIMIAGTPIGSDAFVRQALQQRTDLLLRTTDRIREASDFPMPKFFQLRHSLFVLTAKCVPGGLIFTLRTVCPTVTRPYALALTNALYNLLLCLLKRAELTDENSNLLTMAERQLLRLRVFLGPGFGGIGLLDLEKVAAAAHIGCLRLIGQKVRACLGAETDAASLSVWLPELAASIDALKTFDIELPPELVAGPAFFDRAPSKGVQGSLTEAIDEKLHERARARFPDSDDGKEAKRRFVSASGAHASAMYTAVPSIGALVSDAAFVSYTALRLGLTPVQLLDHFPPGFFRCPFSDNPTSRCKNLVCSRDNLHWSNCSSISFTARHDKIQAALDDAAKVCLPRGLAIVRHPSAAAYLPRKDPTSTYDKQGDLLFSIHGMCRPFIDVVATTPGRQHSARSLRTPGHVADLAAGNKTRDYERHFLFPPAAMIQFYPFSVEVFGTLGTEAVKVIHWLASLAYPLQEVDGKLTDVDGRRSFYITLMFAKISAALAEAQSDRIAAWIDRLLSMRGELVMLQPGGVALAAPPEDLLEGDDHMEVVAAAALGAAPLNVRTGARLDDDMRDVDFNLGEHHERDLGPRLLGARGRPDLNNHYTSGSEGT